MNHLLIGVDSLVIKLNITSIMMTSPGFENQPLNKSKVLPGSWAFRWSWDGRAKASWCCHAWPSACRNLRKFSLEILHATPLVYIVNTAKSPGTSKAMQEPTKRFSNEKDQTGSSHDYLEMAFTFAMDHCNDGPSQWYINHPQLGFIMATPSRLYH
jgi:hypothetical protein